MALEYEKLRAAWAEYEDEGTPEHREAVEDAVRALVTAVGDPDAEKHYVVSVEIDSFARTPELAAEDGYERICQLQTPVVRVVERSLELTGQLERVDGEWREYRG